MSAPWTLARRQASSVDPPLPSGRPAIPGITPAWAFQKSGAETVTGAVVRLEQVLSAGRLERVDDALDVLGVLGSGDQEGVGSIDDDGARHP